MARHARSRSLGVSCEAPCGPGQAGTAGSVAAGRRAGASEDDGTDRRHAGQQRPRPTPPRAPRHPTVGQRDDGGLPDRRLERLEALVEAAQGCGRGGRRTAEDGEAPHETERQADQEPDRRAARERGRGGPMTGTAVVMM